ESMLKGFEETGSLFYVLTNSRGMTPAETERVHEDAARAIAKASKVSGKPYIIMSRSDSTLRGHYPLETTVLERCMREDGILVDGEILCPFFKNGGRFTVGNVHYVKQGDELVPAAETEFARDPSFGYTRSDIPGYIEEKTGGAFMAGDVVCISLEELRSLDISGIRAKLDAVSGFGKVCVNALDICDIKVFTAALFESMAGGKRFMFRTAADLVKVMGGIGDRPLLSREEMVTRDVAAGGLVVVGSHMAKTTRQLELLLTLENTVPIAFDSDLVLKGDEALENEVKRCVALEEEAMKAGKTAVCYTRRKLLALEGDTPEEALRMSVRISDSVQRLVAELSVEPSFIIAKGGITSSDIGTKALGVKRALVLGQILPGIPVWQTDPGSRFPGIPYVIFPGNVGDEDGLKRAVEILAK
ncbi:MAG: hydroxyacid dehydrogenase, partial [Firmicutes bacterium]|nr:hydroxyacid dehydrogenase [Bacillota bacterium]